MAVRRRELLKRAWQAGGALLGLSGLYTLRESLRPLGASAAQGKLKLGNVSRFVSGTATYVPSGRLWVVNTGTTLFALAQKCPHLGCRVPYCESSGRFECPCHGSVFDLGGEWIAGPAPRGMDQFAVSLDGSDLVADLGKRIDGPAHGAKLYLTPPKGPSCIPG